MRAKMDRAERAKQFMPFAALEGLDRTLCDFNRPEDERVCLGEDAQIELDRRLHGLLCKPPVHRTQRHGDEDRPYRPQPSH